MVRKICPSCKKDDLRYLPWLGQIWECPCGWRGVLVVEEDE